MNKVGRFVLFRVGLLGRLDYFVWLKNGLVRLEGSFVDDMTVVVVCDGEEGCCG